MKSRTERKNSVTKGCENSRGLHVYWMSYQYHDNLGPLTKGTTTQRLRLLTGVTYSAINDLDTGM